MAWTQVMTVAGGCLAGCAILRLVMRGLARRRRLWIGPGSMEGRTVVVTGANCGLGEAAARDLAARHARVILACRDKSRAEAAVKRIRRHTSNGQLVVRHLDLASLASVRTFSKQLLSEEPQIHVLVNNAGLFQCPYAKTEDGFEMQMGVNHFGHFLLTNLLLDRLKASAPSRVVVVSSALLKRGEIKFQDIHSEKEYDRRKGYSNSKLANALFCRELSQRLEGTGVAVHCVHPGFCLTNLGRHRMSGFMRTLLSPLAYLLGVKTAEEGAQTIVYCAADPELASVTDAYFGDCKQEDWPENATNLGGAKKLWEISEELTGLNKS